jgi:hypothetical protein
MAYDLAKTGAQIDAIHTKVDGIEALADVTDATNVAAAGGVLNTGNETIAGVKTFSSSPIVPAPTTNLQAATKKYVDDNSGGAPEGTAVLSTGEVGGNKFLREDGDNTSSWQLTGDALVANPLSQFAATTSAQLAGVISNETGSGSLVFGTSPTLVTPLLGTPTSGVLTNCTGTASGLTSGNVTTNANLTGHVTSVGNAAVLGSFTKAQLNTAVSDATMLTTTGTETVTNKTIAAESNTATVFTEAHATSHTLSAAECYGGVYYVTGAATLTLPAVAAGMQIAVYTEGAVAVSIDPNASDKIFLDGTALDDGDKITNLSTSGDVAVLTYRSADGWFASTNSWTDGGA